MPVYARPQSRACSPARPRPRGLICTTRIEERCSTEPIELRSFQARHRMPQFTLDTPEPAPNGIIGPKTAHRIRSSERREFKDRSVARCILEAPGKIVLPFVKREVRIRCNHYATKRRANDEARLDSRPVRVFGYNAARK